MIMVVTEAAELGQWWVVEQFTNTVLEHYDKVLKEFKQKGISPIAYGSNDHANVEKFHIPRSEHGEQRTRRRHPKRTKSRR